MTSNEKYFGFIFICIFMPITFAYVNSKWIKNYKASNIKFRYSLAISSIIMSFPFYIFFGGITFMDELSGILKIENKTIAIGSFVASMILFPIVMRLMRVPNNRDKYYNDKKLISKGFNSWRFYIIHNPADTMARMLRQPPWFRSTPDTKTYVAWKWEAERIAPTSVQIFMLLITYVFTTAGLLAVGFLKDALFIVNVNLYVIPFLIIISLFGSFLFWILRILELSISKLLKSEFKLQQIVKYFLFIGLYVLLISLSLIMIVR